MVLLAAMLVLVLIEGVDAAIVPETRVNAQAHATAPVWLRSGHVISAGGVSARSTVTIIDVSESNAARALREYRRLAGEVARD